MRKLTNLLLLLLLSSFFISCGENSSTKVIKESAPVTQADSSETFSVINNQCISNITATQVDDSLCPDLVTPTNDNQDNSGTISLLYYLSEGNCYDYNSGAKVDISYCQNINVHSYDVVNGNCFSSKENKIVDSSLCPSLNQDSSDEITYKYSNGYCVSSENEVVNPVYCTYENVEEVFYLYSGTCVSSISGQAVEAEKCSDAECRGTYFYKYYNQYIPVNCSTINCSGIDLLDQAGNELTCK